MGFPPAGGGGGAPSGPAGGDLTGTYPNPTIGAKKATASKLGSGAAASGTVATADGSGGVAYLAAAGTGTVTNVSSADTSISVATATTTPVLTVASLDVLATNAPPAASVPLNAKKITGLGLASASTDAASLANTLDQFGAPAANVAMNSKKITGLAAGSGNGDSVRYEQAVKSGDSAGGDLTGTYPSPTIGAGKVTTAQIASAVTLDALATAHATAADVPMNSHKLTGLAAATAAGDAMRWENTPHIYASGVTTMSHNGDTNESILATIPLAAGEIGANGQVQIVAFFKRNAGGTSTVQSAIKFGATGSGTGGTAILGAPSNLLTTSVQSVVELAEFGNANSASSQVFFGITPLVAPYNAALNAQPGTASINTALATEINITGKLGNSGDTITLVYYRVVVYPSA